MMRDHRSQKLRIGHGHLLADHDKEQKRQRAADTDDDQIEVLVAVHGSHDGDLDDGHWRRHQAGHIKLVRVIVDIVDRIHHRVHERIHDDKRQNDHEAKAPVVRVVFQFLAIVRISSPRMAIVVHDIPRHNISLRNPGWVPEFR